MTENKQQFNLDAMRSRPLPYRVPDDFFEKLEEDTVNRVFNSKKRVKTPLTLWRMLLRISIPAAASVALIITFNIFQPEKAEASHLTVEQAFSNLSQDEQDFLIDTYRTDMMLDYE
jgi:hypothetical protein